MFWFLRLPFLFSLVHSLFFGCYLNLITLEDMIVVFLLKVVIAWLLFEVPGRGSKTIVEPWTGLWDLSSYILPFEWDRLEKWSLEVDFLSYVNV